ncbi:MAG: glycosyltransferase family 39 protein [Armatimonadota bacterium]
MNDNNVLFKRSIFTRFNWKASGLVVGVFALILITLLLNYKYCYQGLLTKESMDIAQISRNIYEGAGYKTSFIRPLNTGLYEIYAPPIPEINHAPLVPYITSVFYKIKGVSDHSAVWQTLLFYILTTICIYFLGRVLFSHYEGLLSATLWGLNFSVLKLTLTALEWMLGVFLFTLLALFIVYVHKYSLSNQHKKATIFVILCCIISSALYLTNHLLFFIIIPIMLFLIFTRSIKNYQAAAFVVVFLLLSAPWAARNAMYASFPVIGGTAWDIMTNTDVYPNDTLYRSTDFNNKSALLPLSFPFNHFNAFTKKTTLGIGNQLLGLVLLSGIFVFPFMFVSILYKFKNDDVNALRSFLYLCILFMVFIFSAYGVKSDSQLIFTSVIVCISSGYFLLLLNAKKLHPFYMKSVIGGLIILAALPTIFAIFWKSPEDPDTNYTAALNFFAEIGIRGAGGIVFTDVPWIAAWKTQAEAVWVPRADKDVYNLRNRGLPMHTVILTPESANFSQDEAWWMLHRVKLWREYMKDPSVGVEKILQASGGPINAPEPASVLLNRFRRIYAISETITNLEIVRTDPLMPDDIQIFSIDLPE